MLTFVTVEISQVLEEFVSVAHQDVHYRACLVGISNKYLQETQIVLTCCKNASSFALIIAAGGPAYLGSQCSSTSSAWPASVTSYSLPKGCKRQCKCCYQYLNRCSYVCSQTPVGEIKPDMKCSDVSYQNMI